MLVSHNFLVCERTVNIQPISIYTKKVLLIVIFGAFMLSSSQDFLSRSLRVFK